MSVLKHASEARAPECPGTQLNTCFQDTCCVIPTWCSWWGGAAPQVTQMSLVVISKQTVPRCHLSVLA